MCHRASKPLQTDAEKKAYSRGYNHALRNDRWPLHKPPAPPHSIAAELMESLRALRDAVDGALAKFDPNDELNKELGPHIDRADSAMRKVSKWLKE